MSPYGIDLNHTGKNGQVGEAKSTHHLVITAFLRIAVICITTVVTGWIRVIHRVHLIHVMRSLLIFFHVHVTKPCL